MLRHETGHCNGLPSHHPGARIAFIQDRGQENTKTQTATPGEPVKAASPKAVEPVIEPVKWLGEPAKARNQPPKPEPVKAVEPVEPVEAVNSDVDIGLVASGRLIGEAAMAEARKWPPTPPNSTIKARDDNSRQPWRARTAKPVEPTDPIKPAALSDEDIDGLMAAIAGDEAVQAYGKRKLQRAYEEHKNRNRDSARANRGRRRRRQRRKRRRQIENTSNSETLWNAIGKAAIQDAIDWKKKKAAAQTSEPTTPDNLGAAIAREPMQNVFDKAVAISLHSSLSSIVGIPRTPSHIVP